MSTIGDNSRINEDTAAELRQFVERIERLDQEASDLNDDRKDVYGEMKGRGYDVKTVKRIVAARRKDRDQRLEEDSLFDTYWLALGGD